MKRNKKQIKSKVDHKPKIIFISFFTLMNMFGKSHTSDGARQFFPLTLVEKLIPGAEGGVKTLQKSKSELM